MKRGWALSRPIYLLFSFFLLRVTCLSTSVVPRYTTNVVTTHGATANENVLLLSVGRARSCRTILRARYWEGDDTRWIQRIRRRFSRSKSRDPTPCRNTIVSLNVALFCYQFINAVNTIRMKHPSYWPSEAIEITMDALLGTSILGPLSMDFVHSPSLSRRQPHRYLTAGFLHGGLLHLLVNMDALRRSPAWLETGLGWPLYLTTFVGGIIGGNLWHSWSSLDNSLCLGASGGICALYGLMLTAFVRMGNSQGSSRVVRSMGLLLLYGSLFENISNSAHVGGFLAGLVAGALCGPGYRKSYTLLRKNSLEVDTVSAEFRQAMGFGRVPKKTGLVRLPLVWILSVLALAAQPVYRRIPVLIYRGLLHPGSLSSMRVY